ncbi:MAG: PilZ domain-containing protein [Planctomycetota bacterium]
MTRAATLNESTSRTVLDWAAGRQVALTVSLQSQGRWFNTRSRFIRFSPEEQLVQIAFPLPCLADPQPEVAPGQQLGIAFRRGHKKCIFLGHVVMRRQEPTADGQSEDTLLVRVADRLRELQRRAYQRITVPPDVFIAVKIWEGGPPTPGEPSWPVCSGRLGNVSAGGILVIVREDQNPRLTVGENVGVELTMQQGAKTILAEAQYRHCCLTGSDRLGMGFQFVGLEHHLPGHASVADVAEFVNGLQRQESRRTPHQSL